MAREVRLGDVVFRDGKGFSERAPTQQETIRKTFRIINPDQRLGGGGGGGGGSGGGSSSQPQSIDPSILAEQQAQAQAQQLAIDQATAQAEQQRVSEQQAEQQRTDRINIETQERRDAPRFLETPQVTLPTDDTRFKRGFGEATLGFFGDVGRNVGTFFTGRTDEKFVNPFKSFVDTGATRGERIDDVPQFGTIRTGFGLPTKQEQKEELEVLGGVPLELVGRSTEAQVSVIGARTSKQITDEFQQRVNLGEFGEGQAGVDIATGEAQIEFGKRFSERAGVPIDLQKRFGDLSITSGEQFSQIAPRVIETGVILGVSAVGGPLATTGALTFLGARSIAKGEQFDIRAGTEQFAGIAEFSPESKRGLTMLGFAAGSALFAPGVAARAVTKQRIVDLELQKVKILGTELVKSEKESLLIAGGLRKTESARQQLEFFAPTFKTGTTASGKTTFSLTGGRGISRTEVLDFSLQGVVPKGKDTLKIVEQFSFTARGTSGLSSGVRVPLDPFRITLGSADDVVGSFGSADIIRGGKRTQIGFSGVSQKVFKNEGVEVSNILSGKAGKVGFKASPDKTFDIGTGKLSRFTTGRTLSFDPESFGQVVRLNIKPVADTATTFGTTFSKGTSSVLESQLPTVTSISKGSSQAITKIAQVVKPSVDLGTSTGGVIGKGFISQEAGQIGRTFGAPSSFAGTGKFEQIQLSAPRLNIKQSGLGSIIQVQKSGLDVITEGGQRSILITDFALKPKQISKSRQIFTFDQEPLQKQGQKQIGALSSGFSFVPPPITPGFSPIFNFGVPLVPFAILPLGVPPETKGRIQSERAFQRTPSFGAVVKFQLGLPQIKFGEFAEQSGLFERAFTGKQLIKPLGPFKL